LANGEEANTAARSVQAGLRGRQTRQKLRPEADEAIVEAAALQRDLRGTAAVSVQAAIAGKGARDKTKAMRRELYEYERTLREHAGVTIATERRRVEEAQRDREEAERGAREKEAQLAKLNADADRLHALIAQAEASRSQIAKADAADKTRRARGVSASQIQGVMAGRIARNQVAVQKREKREQDAATRASIKPIDLSKYNPRQLQQYFRCIFKVGDKDASGTLDREELAELLGWSGFKFDLGAVEAILTPL